MNHFIIKKNINYLHKLKKFFKKPKIQIYLYKALKVGIVIALLVI